MTTIDEYVRRRKKCDETKPVCARCTKGEFDCLGYERPKPLSKRNQTQREFIATAPGATISTSTNEESNVISRFDPASVSTDFSPSQRDRGIISLG